MKPPSELEKDNPGSVAWAHKYLPDMGVKPLRVNITHCPPATTGEGFDRYAWEGRKAKAVAARFCRGEDGTLQCRSNGIGYEDYGRMRTDQHEADLRSRIVPTWAFSKTKLQTVIALALERRANIWRNPRTDLPLQQRVELAQKQLLAQEPELTAQLAYFIGVYHHAKAHDLENVLLLAFLSTEIQNLDTRIRVLRRWSALLAAICWYAWNLKWSSNRIGAELELKPCHVRRTLLCLRKIARSQGYEE